MPWALTKEEKEEELQHHTHLGFLVKVELSGIHLCAILSCGPPQQFDEVKKIRDFVLLVTTR
jgi:hypothetical protein